MNAPSLEHNATHVVAVLQQAGFTAYWAGGCVRDMLREQPPKDYDIATSATPDEVIQIFARAVCVGKAFGVVRVRLDDQEFEVATFRRDLPSHDGRHPEGVTFSDPKTDARRRDFTVNALFYDPLTQTIFDYVEGQKDIESRVIRFVGNPQSRIQEDHLRMLRAIRFATTLQFEIAPDTLSAITDSAHLLERISAERIREELCRTLVEAPRAGDALRLLDRSGLLAVILPEVSALKGQEQPPQFHPEGDVFEHTALMLDLMDDAPSHALALSVLLHDIGKPMTARRAKDRIRFHGHANRGATVAESILRRLRCPTRLIETVAHCVGNHMRFMDVRKMRESTLRRLIGQPTFDLELELHRLDCLASHKLLDNHEFLVDSQQRFAAEPALPAPWISGHDIIALGIPEGPGVGTWHKRAYDAQLERRFENREALLEWLRGEMQGPGVEGRGGTQQRTDDSTLS